MLNPTKWGVAALLLGASLSTMGCADDETGGNDTDMNPSVIPDGATPDPDAGAAPRPDGSDPSDAAAIPDAIVPVVDGGSNPISNDGGAVDASQPSDGGSVAPGSCCPDGKCLCHGPAPTALTAERGPYKTGSYALNGVGCVYYPTDAEPPYAAVSVSDGFLGSGGCGSFQTGQWGPLYASWGIVAMIVNTGSGDQPPARGMALTRGIAAFKTENTNATSPLNGKLSGRYGTSGFSMGGGGTTYSAQSDPTLLTDIAIMPWGPVRSGVTVPTLVICGSSDGTAPCASHGTPAYGGIADSVPKMRIQIQSGHAGQPSSGGGRSGQVGLAFQKVFLEGDLRWRPLLVAADSEATNIN